MAEEGGVISKGEAMVMTHLGDDLVELSNKLTSVQTKRKTKHSEDEKEPGLTIHDSRGNDDNMQVS